RQLRGLPVCKSKRRRSVEGLACRGDAGRITLIEQRLDLLRIEFGSGRRRLLRRHGSLGVRLFLLLLGFFFGERVRNRIRLRVRLLRLLGFRVGGFCLCRRRGLVRCLDFFFLDYLRGQILSRFWFGNLFDDRLGSIVLLRGL